MRDNHHPSQDNECRQPSSNCAASERCPIREYRKKRADYSDVYQPKNGAQTVAIEKATSHEDFRTAKEIHALAQREVQEIRLKRVRDHCNWQVDERRLWVRKDR